jgi:hypothetical protein
MRSAGPPRTPVTASSALARDAPSVEEVLSAGVGDVMPLPYPPSGG